MKKSLTILNLLNKRMPKARNNTAIAIALEKMNKQRGVKLSTLDFTLFFFLLSYQKEKNEQFYCSFFYHSAFSNPFLILIRIR